MKALIIAAVIVVSYLIAVVIAKFSMAMDQVASERKFEQLYKEEAEKSQEEIVRLTNDFNNTLYEHREEYRKLQDDYNVLREKHLKLKAQYEDKEEHPADNRIVSRETLR